MIDRAPAPEHGPGLIERVCAACRAEWIGPDDDPPDWCPWCQARNERTVADYRDHLLHPAQLHSDAGNPRYDALDDDSKAVWDRTRGQTRGTDSITQWVTRLEAAVRRGLITETEADRAIRKVTK